MIKSLHIRMRSVVSFLVLRLHSYLVFTDILKCPLLEPYVCAKPRMLSMNYNNEHLNAD